MEYIAIVDLYSKKVAAIEPFKWGDKPADWSWKDGAVAVTDPDGTVNSVRLRRRRPVVKPEQPYVTGWWWGQSANDGWVDRPPRAAWNNRSRPRKKNRRRRKTRSLFNFLFD